MTRPHFACLIFLVATLLGSRVGRAEASETAAASETDAEILSRALVTAAATAAPAVVSIHVTRTLKRSETETSASGSSRRRGQSAREASGSPYFKPRNVASSGLVWSEDGEILTSSWNIGRAVDAIAVSLADGTVHEARLLGYDEVYDLALLRLVDPPADLPTLERIEGEARPGQLVLAVGRSLATDSHTASTGVLSALDRRPGEDFIGALQHSARINYANVGGPLVDIQGRLIALTVGLNSDPAVNPAGLNSGVGFAVPVHRLEQHAGQLRKGMQRKRPEPLGNPGKTTPLVGVHLQDGVRGEGVRITRVVPDSGASLAGLEPGDLILEFTGTRVVQRRTVMRLIRTHEIGEEVEVLVRRDGEEMTFTIKLGKRND